jgi:GcrA cell cycle regulator
MGFKWTEARENQLRERWPNSSAGEIAEMFGTSRNSIIGKAHRLGIEKSVPKHAAIKSPDSPRRVHRKKVVSPAVDVFIPATTPIPSLATIETVQAGECRWPMNDSHGAHMAVCGRTSVRNKPYCAEHAKLSFVQSRSKPESDQRNFQLARQKTMW